MPVPIYYSNIFLSDWEKLLNTFVKTAGLHGKIHAQGLLLTKFTAVQKKSIGFQERLSFRIKYAVIIAKFLENCQINS